MVTVSSIKLPSTFSHVVHVLSSYTPRSHPPHVSRLSAWVSPYLPGYVFPLPFGWQPSLFEASCAHWGVTPSLRSAYSGVPETPLGLPRSTQLRCHWGGCLLYRGEWVSSKSVHRPDFPCSLHHRISRLR